MWKFLIKVGFAALLFTAAAGANAQSTVWNTPSTDALDEGATLVEVDFLTHFGPTERGAGVHTFGIDARIFAKGKVRPENKGHCIEQEEFFTCHFQR